MIPVGFLRLFENPAPAVVFRQWPEAGFSEFGVFVKHRLNGPAPDSALPELRELDTRARAPELDEFYSAHNGAELCVRFNGQAERDVPMITFYPTERWAELTAAYQPGGTWDWTIDYNSYRKTSQLYRGPNRWIVFAMLDSGATYFDNGPACLTLFLDGPCVGNVFYLAPEPGFNIRRPIAKSFYQLLERIQTDLAAFLRLCGVMGTFRGPQGGYFGLDPIQYLPDARGQPYVTERGPYD